MARHALGPGCIDDLTEEQAAAIVAQRIASREPSQIITLNALMFNAILTDQQLCGAVSRAALVIPDSAGIQWATRILCGIRLERIAGIDFIYSLAAKASVNGWRIFLLGAKQGVAEASAKKLLAQFPRLCIAGTHHGYLFH
jgi:N-acetylglucosaminyldiphosphoundecaprenol N-acetyl-beta-D-mannosaminyltransferase